MSLPKAQFNEMAQADGSWRKAYELVGPWFQEAAIDMLAIRRAQVESWFRRIGITFAVYGDKETTERLIPFDVVPRVMMRKEWTRLEKGLRQRVSALNMLLRDLYNQQEIVRAGKIPLELVLRNPAFRPEMFGHRLPHDLYVHIAGIDIVRVDDEDFYVLEDNLRTPSGASYMLENREVMLRMFPELFTRNRVLPVEDYADALLACLTSLAPGRASGDPTVVLLTPGQFNSAYYEHSFLADKMGIELVEGRDLFVREDVLYMRTTEGPKRVDVVYRRLDDEFLDPLMFRPDSMLGVPGLMSAYLAGNVTLSNAVGTGVADDKAMYTYIPDAIRFYLGEEPILKNVPTYRCREPDDLAYVLAHLPELVVKEVHGSGGYGMLVGPHSTKEQIAAFSLKLRANPFDFIAQPTLSLSTCPISVETGLAPRHVDLRPFVLSSANGIRIVPGGLTRVAMREGSLVVNSSQGGGTKDTWVIDEEAFA